MILCDTGPILAAAVRSDTHYHRCTEMFTGLRLAGRRLLVPTTVVAEVGYLLERRAGTRVEAAFLQSIADGDFEAVALEPADFGRMAELVLQYADLPLGTTDASLIALAERLNVTDVATIDRKHFTIVRPRHVSALALLPD